MRARKDLILLGILIPALNAVPDVAADSPVTAIDDLVAYGADQATNELVRYSFATDSMVRVGTIREAGGSVVTGIEALAHLPAGQHKAFYGATNTGDNARLVRIDPLTADALLLDTGLAEISGMAAIHGTGASPLDDFDITDKTVVPGQDYAVRFTVLGCALSLQGQYNMPVTVEVNIGGTVYEPFGRTDRALGGGDVNDGLPHQWIAPGTFEAGTPISLMGRAYNKYSGYSGNFESHWYLYQTVGSTTESEFLMVLRDGDPVPPVPGFLDQDALVDFVRPFVDPSTDTVVLGDHQAIFCFELGAPDVSHPSADFQDCVVLVSLADDPGYFHGDGDWMLLAVAREVPGGDQKLVVIDPGSGANITLADLGRGDDDDSGRPYEGLALAADGSVLAVSGDQLWRIDPASGDQTLIGDSGYDDLKALDFAFGETEPRVATAPHAPDSWSLDGALLGLDAEADALVIVNPSTGATREYDSRLADVDAEGLVFLTHRTDPYGVIIADSHD
jgi:hypothetical protein